MNLRTPVSLSMSAFLLVTLGATLSVASARKSLDEAVNEQLVDGCFVLLGNDTRNRDELRGNLNTFCGGSQGSGPPLSAASGGGAVSPASAPGVIQRQQREQLLAAAEGEGHVLAASGDAARLDLGNRWSLFVLGRYADINKNSNRFADGYESDRWGASVGGSYRFRSDAVTGLAFDYFHEDGDYDRGGDFKIDSYGLIAFGAFTRERLIIQGSGGYARRNYERTRRAEYLAYAAGTANFIDSLSGRPSADFDGNAYFLEGSVSSVWRWSGILLSPFVSLGWSRVDYESYKEKGNSGLEMRFDDERRKSLLSAVGMGASKAFGGESMSLVLGADLSWLHEFKDDQRNVNVSFVHDTGSKTFSYSTEKPDRNFGLFGASLVGVLPNGLRPFIQFQAVFANRNYDLYLASFGLNVEF